jgi:hypothetical protein
MAKKGTKKMLNWLKGLFAINLGRIEKVSETLQAKGKTLTADVVTGIEVTAALFGLPVTFRSEAAAAAAANKATAEAALATVPVIESETAEAVAALEDQIALAKDEGVAKVMAAQASAKVASERAGKLEQYAAL